MLANRVLLTSLGAAFLGAPLLVPLVRNMAPSIFGLSAFFYATQDGYGLLLVAALAGIAWLVAARIDLRPELLRRLGERKGVAVAVAVFVVAVAYLGTKWIFGSTPVSYDEVQANFDARVFLGGHLAAPVPEDWRPYLPALAPIFFLDIPGGAAWVSGYWPVNAALRALAELTVGMDWSSPLLALVAILATWNVARKLWPGRPDAALVAILLVATSPQVLVTAMTPYAMTAHLAFNMVWLALFLNDRPRSHAGAIVVGALAVGLHQIVFHALFAAPFILLLLTQRRFRLTALYVTAYAVIGLAWMSYPQVLVALNVPQAGVENPVAWLVVKGWGDSVQAGITGHDEWASLTFFNLARLAAWLNPVLIVLFAIGLAEIRRLRAIEIAMAGGVLLTFIAMTLILPYQGHGWGYRYLHGHIGCMALIGAGVWTRRINVRQWMWLPVTASALSLAILVPMNAAHAQKWVAPISAALDLIRQAPADIVLVDDFVFSQDLVRNRPDLSNRPLTMLLRKLDAAALKELCATHSIAIFDRTTGARLGMAGAGDERKPEISPQRAFLDANCRAQKL